MNHFCLIITALFTISATFSVTCLPVDQRAKRQQEQVDTTNTTDSSAASQHLQRMASSLNAMRLLIGRMYPKVEGYPKEEQRSQQEIIEPTLRSIKRLMDLSSLASRLNSQASSTDKTLDVTAAMLKVLVKDSCEWMKSALVVDESFNCDNETDAYAIVTIAEAKTIVNDTVESINTLSGGATKSGPNVFGCKLILCNLSPQCGSSPVSSEAFEYISNNFYNQVCGHITSEADPCSICSSSSSN